MNLELASIEEYNQSTGINKRTFKSIAEEPSGCNSIGDHHHYY